MCRVIVSLFFICGLSLANEHQIHLLELKNEFPYGLLTDDFGVLSEQDLRTNTCIARPTPFSEENEFSPYPYWQCFEVKNSKMICERGQYDRHEKTIMSILVVSGTRDGTLHEFISRRPIPIRSCWLYQKDWRTFTSNEKYICVSGAEPSRVIKEKKTMWIWIFGRYKTKKGCDSYFDGECEGKITCNR